MRHALLAFVLTVLASVVLLAACFNKGTSTTPGFDGGQLPDVLLPGVNLFDSGTKRYSVGGVVDGLQGSGLVLEGDGVEDVAIAPAPGGGPVSFTFKTLVPAGLKYSVVVKSQPAMPTQNCTVLAGTGTVPHSNVTGIVVNCSTKAFAISGNVTGLEGSSLLLYDNGTDAISVVANGTFAFDKLIPSGGMYSVTLGPNPQFPAETCTLLHGSGVVTNANVINVTVNCIPNVYNVGGTVVGLVGSGLVLTDNGTDSVTITANGAFTFPTPVTSGSPYTATIMTQPTAPAQVCTIAAAMGTVGDGDVATIVVDCASNTYTVTGNVNGLMGQGLVLNTSAGSIPITSNGGFALPAAFQSGASYSVSVGVQPTGPSQFCTVTGGDGVIANANVTGVAVQCMTNVFTVGGQVENLPSGTSIVLTNEGGDNVTVAASGPFTFPTPVASGSLFSVGITQPPGSMCTVQSGGTGVIASADYMGAIIDCAAASSNGDFCASLASDPNNCGRCGNVCAANEVCTDGRCACPGGNPPCNGACLDFTSDSNNCGYCGNTCPSGYRCQNSGCACLATMCSDGTCVDTVNDSNHCGGCTTVCPAGRTCRNSQCQCPSGETTCVSLASTDVEVAAAVNPEYCANTTNDPNNCGSCNHVCPTDEDGGQLPCTNGSCCGAGLVACAGVGCVNTQTDPNNCGVCGNVCPNGMCQGGSCCAANQILCGTTCVSDTADPNCGSCGVTCNQYELSCGTDGNGNSSCCTGAQTGQTACPSAGGCTDTTSDVNNCGPPGPGSCGNVCAGGQPACCSSGCVDESTDPFNCNGCGNVCPQPNGSGFATCAIPPSASAPLPPQCGVQCYGNDVYCASTNTCTDLTSDPNNCGGCDVVCPAPADTNAFATCASPPTGGPAQCGSQCDAGDTQCGTPPTGPSDCVDETSDPNNCGACGSVCPIVGGDTVECSGSACKVTICPAGFVDCDGLASNGCEVNIETDNNNCGACGTMCSQAETCQGGICACPVAGDVLCNGSCIDPTDYSTDQNNCGFCGDVCPNSPTGAQYPCQNGSCCPAGQGPCNNGFCVDTMSDPNNCGGCGIICPAGLSCVNSSCCPAGQVVCNGACVDEQTDPNNCGGCGTECPTGASCASGSCCAPPQTLCGPNSNFRVNTD